MKISEKLKEASKKKLKQIRAAYQSGVGYCAVGCLVRDWAPYGDCYTYEQAINEKCSSLRLPVSPEEVEKINQITPLNVSHHRFLVRVSILIKLNDDHEYTFDQVADFIERMNWDAEIS